MVEFCSKPPFQFSNRLGTASFDLLRALCSGWEDPLGLGAQLCHTACQHLPIPEAETPRRLRGSNGVGIGGAEPQCPHAWPWLWVQAVGAISAHSQSWSYCWFSREGVREPAEGFWG